MPVRFQVDADFYDHPKTLDMSDAATALWVRAGSYSAAKLTDGFVADAMLARLSRTPDDAARELVRRGLWRRVRGGYRFHDWESRGNLTRERVEAERSADRQRKRRVRQEARQNPNQHVDSGSVRPESGPDSNRTPNGIRGLSVSVSESVSSPPLAPQLDDTAEPPKQGRRKRRASEIPDGWKPTSEHIDRAREAGLNLDREVQKFQAHAQANDRRQANWNGAFTQWLLHAEEYSRPTRKVSAETPSGWWDN